MLLVEYAGVLLLLLFAIFLTGGTLAAQLWLGPRLRSERKLESLRSGETRGASPRPRQASKFCLIAILFLVFDVAAVFFHPWGATFQETRGPGLIAMGLFALPLCVGFAYAWAKGAFEW